jgi:hypothetical protein
MWRTFWQNVRLRWMERQLRRMAKRDRDHTPVDLIDEVAQWHAPQDRTVPPRQQFDEARRRRLKSARR